MARGRNIAPDESPDDVLESWLKPPIKPYCMQVDLIGHRVVHGGESFTAPTLINAELEATLWKLAPLAPLHNSPALRGLARARRWGEGLPPWTCFDTAFHSSLPEAAYSYAIPGEFRRQGLRCFGFHATLASAGQGPFRAAPDQCPPRGRFLPGRCESWRLHRHNHGLHTPGRPGDGDAFRNRGSRSVCCWN